VLLAIVIDVGERRARRTHRALLHREAEFYTNLGELSILFLESREWNLGHLASMYFRITMLTSNDPNVFATVLICTSVPIASVHRHTSIMRQRLFFKVLLLIFMCKLPCTNLALYRQTYLALYTETLDCCYAYCAA
jgi:hypothetical protein